MNNNSDLESRMKETKKLGKQMVFRGLAGATIGTLAGYFLGNVLSDYLSQANNCASLINYASPFVGFGAGFFLGSASIIPKYIKKKKSYESRNKD